MEGDPEDRFYEGRIKAIMKKRKNQNQSNDNKKPKKDDSQSESCSSETTEATNIDQVFPLQDLPDDILAFIFKTYFDFEERQELRCVGPWFYEKLTAIDPSFRTWNINLSEDSWDFETVERDIKEALDVRDQSHTSIEVDCDSWKSSEKVSFLTFCGKQIKSLSIVLKKEDVSLLDSKFAFESLERLRVTAYKYHAKKLNEGDMSPRNV